MEGLHIQLNKLEICKISNFLENEKGFENIIHKHPASPVTKNFRFEFIYEKEKKSKVILQVEKENLKDWLNTHQ